MSPPHLSGILDATLVEAILHPARALDTHDIERLMAAFPLASVPSAVPILSALHPASVAMRPTAAAAQVLEPLDLAAHATVTRNGASTATVLVDPRGVRVGDAPLSLDMEAPLQREVVVWTRPATAAKELVAALRTTCAPLPGDVRVRLRDPYGAITPDTIPTLLDVVPPERLTLWIEDAHHLAHAVARVALHEARPPLVRTTLLGIGPRTGAAATELLVDAPLHDAARTLAGATGHRIGDTHPLWGPRVREATEPELLAWHRTDPDRPLAPRYAPGTLRDLVAAWLVTWGAPADAAIVDRLTAAVATRLRPGERPDGPTLYTIAATILDLPSLALAGPPHEEGP